MMNADAATRIASALLPEARIWLRRSGSDLDSEIQQTISACMLDMNNTGVLRLRAEDPLIQQAAKLYLKAHFGYDEKRDRWEAAYERLKNTLSLSSDYNREGQADG